MLGRLADRLVNISPLARRYLVLCLTVNSGVTRPCQLSRSLGVSLRTLEREMQEEQVPSPLRMAVLARLLRVAWLMQSEDHCLATVATALGFSYPSVVSRLLRRAGFTAESIRGPLGLEGVVAVLMGNLAMDK